MTLGGQSITHAGNVTANIVNSNTTVTGDLYANTATLGGNLYYPDTPESFTIWKDTDYYARNGETGAITSNAILSTLLTNVNSTLGNAGGLSLSIKILMF